VASALKEHDAKVFWGRKPPQDEVAFCNLIRADVPRNQDQQLLWI